METERIYNLIEQGPLVQQTYFMHNDNGFSQIDSSESDIELFDEFSPPKVMLVGNCSKRSSAIDRELVISTKKRKQIHYDSDLWVVSPDEDLQENENHEEIIISSCQKFRKNNSCESIANAEEKGHEESNTKFDLHSSICVKADDSSEWIRLKCFDSITGSNNATFFAGGPIQSSAFSILPHDKKVNQYIAVAVSNVIHTKHSYNNTENMNGIIQFWNLGSLREQNTLNQSPSMELALYHDNGMISQMQWCPADYFDKLPSKCQLPRLGLLAVSSSDSHVYIYRVPQPDFMPKSKSTFPIYFTLPFMKLMPLFGEPSYATRKALATCIEWAKNGERIVGGYGNGVVCVWRTKVSSFASNITVKSTERPYVIQPYLFFQASGAPITSLSFAPFSNHRWLVVTSIDKILRFFDLHDTSVPFHVVKQGPENSCVWGDAFCGVYSTPGLDRLHRLSLFSKDCCRESNDRGLQKGLFDSSICVAASENKNFHAVADMAGAVFVNFLENISNPLKTSYITYKMFETEIMALDNVDQELKTSGYKISISNNNITSDTSGVFYPNIKKGSSSSSSGFCSPNRGKKIIIEATKLFDNDAVNLLKNFSESSSSSMNDLKDINNKRAKVILEESLNSVEGTNNEMIKFSEGSDDLMHYLLMMKIYNPSKFKLHKMLFKTGDNSACCDSKGAKYCSEKALATSPAATDYTDDTIIYSIESFCDTSHPDILKSDAPSKNFILSDNGNPLTTVHKNEELTLKTELFTENSLIFSSADAKSGSLCLGKNSSSKNPCDPNDENRGLNYKCRTLRNSKGSNDFHFTSAHSDLRDQCGPDGCSSTANDNFVICDKIEHRFSDGTLIQSSATSDFSGDTIIYYFPLHDSNATDANYLNAEKSSSLFQSLYKSEKESTFQDTSLNKMDEKEVVIQRSQAKLSTESCSFAREKGANFRTKESLRSNSDYETNSATLSRNLSDGDKNFFSKDLLLSDFKLLYPEYSNENSEEKDAESNMFPKSNKNPQELSYENLIDSFGIIFKNNLNESTKPLRSQKHDIYVGYNPLSVIKTISWDPNEGCQSWLFVGGNSGIGRLVFVPDSLTDVAKNPKPKKRR